MPLFIVKNNPGFLKPIVLEKEDEHHLVRVMRVKAGQALTITDNHGQTLQTEIVSLKPLEFRALQKGTMPAPHPLTVCLPLIDQTRLEWAVEKLCELNVQTVQLISTERCQFKTLTEKKMERLHKISEAAQKQCERAWPLVICEAVPLNMIIIDGGSQNFVGVLMQEAGGRKQEQTNRTSTLKHFNTSTLSMLFIGPEGGFTDAEIDFLLKKNVVPISLPTNILRTETAAISLTSAIIASSF